MLNQFPKRCACGAVYSAEEWAGLPRCGEPQSYPWREVVEYRHCGCRSTIGVVLVEGDPEEQPIACCARCSRVDVLTRVDGEDVCGVCKARRPSEAA